MQATKNKPYIRYNNTTATTVLRPFVQDYAVEPVPEETLTHPPSWSSSNLYQILPSTTIHSIFPVWINFKLHDYSIGITSPTARTAELQLCRAAQKCKNVLIHSWGNTVICPAVSPDGVAPIRMVSVSASVNLPSHHKSRSFGTGSPGWSRKKRAVKQLWCGVVSFLLTCEMHLRGWCLLSGCDGGGDGSDGMWRWSVEAHDSLSEVVTQWCSDGG